MTTPDTDDGGLGDLYQLRLEADLSSDNWYDCEENRYLLWDRERALKLLDRLESQREEIEKLKLERDIANEAWKGTRSAELREQVRAERAETALAEALNHAGCNRHPCGS